MNKPARRTIDAAIGLGMAGLVLLIAQDPSTPQPDPTPDETFTHVELIVDDSGVTAQPSRADAGQVEFTVVDRRTDKNEPLQIRSEPPAIETNGGSSLTALRTLGHYVLVAEVDDTKLRRTSTLDVRVPVLAAPEEAADRVTLDVRDDVIMATNRETRRGMPIASFTSSFASIEHQPWTAVVAGPAEIVVRNRTSALQACEIDDEKVDIEPGKRETLRVAFTDAPPRAQTLRCTGAGTPQSFGFWVG